MKKLSPAVAIWLAWFITAANLLVAKYAVPYVTSALFLFFSCVGAVLCFVPYLNRTGGWKLLLDKKLFWQYLGLGTLGTALPMTVFMIALNYTTPTNGAILNQFEISSYLSFLLSISCISKVASINTSKAIFIPGRSLIKTCFIFISSK